MRNSHVLIIPDFALYAFSAFSSSLSFLKSAAVSVVAAQYTT
jgi:hypothetical protein